MYPVIRAISIDDDEINLAIIEEMASDLGIRIKSFEKPLEALQYAIANEIDIVFTDYMMPEMDGIDFTKQIRLIYPDIFVIMITSVSEDHLIKMRALEAGATEFLNKPLVHAEFKARVYNLANLRKTQLLLKDKALLLAEEVRKATATIQHREYESLKILSKVSEYKDPETANHIERVSHYSRLLARLLNEDEETQDLIFYSAPLHDIGKVAISDNILLKPGKLTTYEYTVVQKHSEIGYNILKDTESIYLKAGAQIAITHHEKYNGTGYPRQLKAHEIPLFGRIVAVADVFDALTTRRPYKEAWSIEDAVNLLVSEKGKHFDPQLVDQFVNHIGEVMAIFKKYQDS